MIADTWCPRRPQDQTVIGVRNARRAMETAAQAGYFILAGEPLPSVIGHIGAQGSWTFPRSLKFLPSNVTTRTKPEADVDLYG